MCIKIARTRKTNHTRQRVKKKISNSTRKKSFCFVKKSNERERERNARSGYTDLQCVFLTLTRSVCVCVAMAAKWQWTIFDICIYIFFDGFSISRQKTKRKCSEIWREMCGSMESALTATVFVLMRWKRDRSNGKRRHTNSKRCTHIYIDDKVNDDDDNEQP